MQRKFITNLALLLFLNLLVKPFWILGIDRTVQNVTGAEEYGFYFAILNFSFLFNILLDLGITNFNNRNIARHHQLLTKHFSGIVSLRLALAVVYFAVTITAGLLIGYNTRQMTFLAILGGNQFIASFILYLRSNISGLLMFRADSILSVLDRLLMILICGILLWTNVAGTDFRIEWFILAQTAAYSLTALAALLIVLRRSSVRRITLKKAFSLMILKQSFPFAVLILLMTFYNRIDSVLLERLLPGSEGNYQAGIYASAWRLLDAMNQIAFLFAGLLLPIFSHMIRKGDAVAPMVRMAFNMLFTLSLSVAMFSAFYSFELMDLFYRDHEEDSAAVFFILMWCFVPVATTYVFGTLLTANGNLFYLNMVAGSGMILNILLNVLLIPEYLALGSAMASLVTQVVMAVAQVWLAIRYFRLKIDTGYMLRLLMFIGGVSFLAWLSVLVRWPWWIGLLVGGSLALLLSMTLRLIHIGEIRTILRNRGEEDA